MNINPVNFALVNQSRLVKSKNNNHNAPKVSFGFTLSEEIVKSNNQLTKALNEYVKARGTALEEVSFENFMNAATNLINMVVARMGNPRIKDDLNDEARTALWDILKKFDQSRTQNPLGHIYTKLQKALIDVMRLERAQTGLSRREAASLKLIEELTKVDESGNKIPTTVEEVIKLAKARYRNSSSYVTSKKYLQDLIDNGPTVQQRLSLDAPIKSQRREENGTRVIDKLNLSEEGKVNLTKKRNTKATGDYEGKIIAQIDFDSAMQKLSNRHQTVLSLYFFEGLTIEEIAHELNVTKSRVSQINQEALEVLRQNLSSSGPKN